MTRPLSIEREILTAAPVDVVGRTVTEPDQVSKWFSDEAGLAATPGYRGALTFYDKATHRPARLRVTETGLERLGWPRDQQDTYAREHDEGWATHLGRLQDLLTRQPAGQDR